MDIEGKRVRLDVLSLRRGDGGLVRMRFTLTNVSGQTFTVYDAIDLFGGRSLHARLLDPAGQKLYMPVTDSRGQCLCSPYPDEDIAAGGSSEFYVTLPPVPPSVKTVTVMLWEFPVIDRVPLDS